MGAQMGAHMGAPMGAQMGMGAPGQMVPGPVSMGYYANTMPPAQYGMQVDANGMRYAILPETDPRIILANRQKKVLLLHTPSILSVHGFIYGEGHSADNRHCVSDRKSSAEQRQVA